MKRILLPAGGAILATGLLAAGLAGTAAQADDTVQGDAMTAAARVDSVVKFWTAANGAALKQASAYTFDYKKVDKIVQKGGYSPDTKPSSVPAIGSEPKKTLKYQNINVPLNVGRVFFSIGDKLYWCSGASVQSQYRNLVATAGHCTYDIAGNNHVLENWVFVPGYYQGKAPKGVYVGKQAFTHYDFANYEDFDRDYAFVTVYNGLKFGGTDQRKYVSLDEWKKFQGIKGDDKQTVTKEEYAKGKLDPATTDLYDVDPGADPELAGPDYPGAVVDKLEVTKAQYDAAKVGKGQLYKFGEPITENVTYKDAVAYLDNQKKDPAKFPGEVKLDEKINSTITHYYVQKWYKPGKEVRYFKWTFYIVTSASLDGGRLGDAVGGQGVAFNQPTGKYYRVFGYPGGEHPDGNKPYTGVTPKWVYGKASAKATVVAAYKVEEQVALKGAVTGGFDGGVWLYKYSNAKRSGYVNGVTSLILDVDGNNRYDTITTPYFDGETNAVYKAAIQWSGKLY